MIEGAHVVDAEGFQVGVFVEDKGIGSLTDHRGNESRVYIHDMKETWKTNLLIFHQERFYNGAEIPALNKEDAA